MSAPPQEDKQVELDFAKDMEAHVDEFAYHNQPTEEKKRSRSRSAERPGPPPEDEQQNKVFIGGLSWETTDDGLKNYFRQFGEIHESMVMRDRVTGQSRGFGFVTYRERSGVDKVLKANLQLDGRKIDAKEAFPRGFEYRLAERNSGREPVIRTCKVFCGGLSPDTTGEDLEKYFSKYGEVSSAQIMVDHTSGHSRGFGFVIFANEDTVDKVCDVRAHKIKDRSVECRRATPKRLMDMARGHRESSRYPPPPPPSYYYRDRYDRDRYDRYYDRYGPPPRDRGYDRYDRYDRYGPPPPYGRDYPPYDNASPPRDYRSRGYPPAHTQAYAAPAPYSNSPTHDPAYAAASAYQQPAQQQPVYDRSATQSYMAYDPNAAAQPAQPVYDPNAAASSYGAYPPRTSARTDRSYHPYR